MIRIYVCIKHISIYEQIVCKTIVDKLRSIEYEDKTIESNLLTIYGSYVTLFDANTKKLLHDAHSMSIVDYTLYTFWYLLVAVSLMEYLQITAQGSIKTCM